MISSFAPVFLVALLGAVFIFGVLLLSFFLRPSVPDQNKSDIYECGERPIGQAWTNTNIRFYVIALIFLIFEVEVAFMYPVAASYKGWVTSGNGLVALFEVTAFVGILAVAIIYAWVKGDFEWVRTVAKTKTAGRDANAVPVNLKEGAASV